MLKQQCSINYRNFYYYYHQPSWMERTFKIMFKEDHPRTITANLKLVPCYLRRRYKCGFFLIKACPICIIEQTKNLWQIPITYVELLISCRCSLISAHCHLKWSCHHVILNGGWEWLSTQSWKGTIPTKFSLIWFSQVSGEKIEVWKDYDVWRTDDKW